MTIMLRYFTAEFYLGMPLYTVVQKLSTPYSKGLALDLYKELKSTKSLLAP